MGARTDNVASFADRTQAYRIALGSAREVRAALAVAAAMGYVGDVGVADALADRVCAMTWRMISA